jgi:hypothetical protein
MIRRKRCLYSPPYYSEKKIRLCKEDGETKGARGRRFPHFLLIFTEKKGFIFIASICWLRLAKAIYIPPRRAAFPSGTLTPPAACFPAVSGCCFACRPACPQPDGITLCTSRE